MSQEVMEDVQSANGAIAPEPTNQERFVQFVMNWSPAKPIGLILILWILFVISVLYFNFDPSAIPH